MRLLPARPSWPCPARRARTACGRESARTMYQAMPALILPPTLTAVSRAPYSLPLTYVTCCIRVSLLSNVDSTSGLYGSGSPLRAIEHVSLLRHWPSGNGPVFWLDGGGNV